MLKMVIKDKIIASDLLLKIIAHKKKRPFYFERKAM